MVLSLDNYRACLARAKRALSSGTFPSETLSLIEADIATTLPALHIFHSEMGPLYQDLKDMLCAWVVSRSDEGLGYTTGVSRVAAMFLISMPPQQGFVVMRNLLERHCMRSFYGGAATKDDVGFAFSRMIAHALIAFAFIRSKPTTGDFLYFQQMLQCLKMVIGFLIRF